ncbi:MAG: T9SS type A sorting domain-containing protein [Flavobacteriales bacterium]
MIVALKNLCKKNPKTSKWMMMATAGAVLVVFGSAGNRKHTYRYHSHAEMLQYRSMQQGDLPVNTSDMFIGSGKCAGCHGVDGAANPIANITSEGENVSPSENWRATMMANSSKDPFWLAKVQHEIAVNPQHEALLINKCTSCHAPLGRFEAVHDGIENYTMEMLAADSLARDGVSCMACHSQQIETTGNVFSGELTYNADTVWGPLLDIAEGEPPMYAPIMTNFVLVEPVGLEKFSQSETCAGCHSLVTHTVDLEGEFNGNHFIEQATYHEWLNSTFSTTGAYDDECQGCHMPRTTEPIILASGYTFLPHREPYGQHWLVGGNTFMLELMKDHIEELDITATEEHFNTVIDRTTQQLQNQTATLELITDDIDGDTARYTVKLTNLAGHKFPSGYPSRRAYIELVMTDVDGNEIFHSGELMPDYEVYGQNADWEPHYDVITNDDEVQIYEMVMADVNGNVTTVLERADHLIKDNRLVPEGFSVLHAAYDTTMIVGGAATDPNFNHIAGVEGTATDEVHYHIPVSGISGVVTVSARLMYQSLPPKWNEEMFSVDNPVINEFETMYLEQGAEPVEVAASETYSTLVHTERYADFFRISPNPTYNGQVRIDAGKDLIKEISIYAISGALIEKLRINQSNAVITLPKTTGTYLLEVTTNRGSRVEKVLRR